jgi:hypothetical protein
LETKQDDNKFLSPDFLETKQRITTVLASADRKTRPAKTKRQTSRSKSPLLPLPIKETRKRDEVPKLRPSNPSPVPPAATLSDISHSSDEARRQSPKRVSDRSDDDIINLMVDVETVRPSRRDPAIAPVVPPPPRTVTTLYIRPKPRPFGTPSPPQVSNVHCQDPAVVMEGKDGERCPMCRAFLIHNKKNDD